MALQVHERDLAAFTEDDRDTLSGPTDRTRRERHRLPVDSDFQVRRLGLNTMGCPANGRTNLCR